MPVVTEERYKIAVEIEGIAVKYGVPRKELMDLVEHSFEAGQSDGLTTYATMMTSHVNERMTH